MNNSIKLQIAIMGIRGIPARYSGFETCAEQTAIRFANKHDVYVFCRKYNLSPKDNNYKGVNLIQIRSIKTKHLDTLSHTFFCSLYIIFKPKIKIIHLYNTANAMFIPLLRLFGKKVLISVDGLEWKRLKWGFLGKMHYKISEYISAKTANKIIADSKIIQDYYINKFKIQPIYVPYGAQLDTKTDVQLLKKYKLEPKKYLLFVGRLVPEKGVHNLIQAYVKLKTNIPLVIIGDDPHHSAYLKSIKKIANNNIRFLGFIFGKEYETINKYAYVYVTASLIEGTSPALVNAMGAGNCVLVNGTLENLETIGDSGCYYEENNIDDLSNKIKMLIDNTRLVNEYAEKARQRVDKYYNWDKISERYIKLFDNLYRS